jgi:hypothetical protein
MRRLSRSSAVLLEADNLKYDGRNIHWAYNAWIAEVERSIQDEVRFRFEPR